jgi:hypothetical protein
MNPRNYETKNALIRDRFRTLKAGDPRRSAPRLNLSWSNWGFGMEALRG